MKMHIKLLTILFRYAIILGLLSYNLQSLSMEYFPREKVFLGNFTTIDEVQNNKALTDQIAMVLKNINNTMKADKPLFIDLYSEDFEQKFDLFPYKDFIKENLDKIIQQEVDNHIWEFKTIKQLTSEQLKETIYRLIKTLFKLNYDFHLDKKTESEFITESSEPAIETIESESWVKFQPSFEGLTYCKCVKDEYRILFVLLLLDTLLIKKDKNSLIHLTSFASGELLQDFLILQEVAQWYNKVSWFGIDAIYSDAKFLQKLQDAFTKKMVEINPGIENKLGMNFYSNTLDYLKDSKTLASMDLIYAIDIGAGFILNKPQKKNLIDTMLVVKDENTDDPLVILATKNQYNTVDLYTNKNVDSEIRSIIEEQIIKKEMSPNIISSILDHLESYKTEEPLFKEILMEKFDGETELLQYLQGVMDDLNWTPIIIKNEKYLIAGATETFQTLFELLQAKMKDQTTFMMLERAMTTDDETIPSIYILSKQDIIQFNWKYKLERELSRAEIKKQE